MRDTAGRNAPQVADVKKFAHDNKVDMRPIELDVSSEKSIEAAIRQIVAEQSRLDVLMHNAGHMVFGPAEAFTPEQLAELYDINVLSQLLRRECFRRSKDHVPGIVHEDIEPALFGDNLADRRFDGFLRRHVQFNGAHVNLIVVRKLFHVRNLRCVAAGGIPHRGVDSVAGLREGIGGQTAKAARSSSDYDYLLHD